MKVSDIKVFHCDAGWRPWTFVKVVTDDGLVGWSECSDSFGSTPGVAAVIHDLARHVIGEDPRAHEKIFWKLYSATRQSVGGVIQKAIAGIENALLDIKAKSLSVPVYELLGGKIRDRVPLYWSHCITTRVRSASHVHMTPVRSIEDAKAMVREVKQRGFKALKTNIVVFEPEASVYMAGFGKTRGGPELNIERRLLEGIVKYVEALTEVAGNEVDIILDLNFNFRTDGFKQIIRALAPFNLMWLEIDSYDPNALRTIRECAVMPICSGENLYGLRQFRPFLEQHSMDVTSIDLLWNGLWQSKKIADAAEVYEVNVTPHNHYSHLGSFMAAHFSAAIPNFKILEIDVDDVPWKDALVTVSPKIMNGFVEVSSGPGWGAEINEEVLRAHPWPK